MHPAKAALLRRGNVLCSMISYPRDRVQRILIRLIDAETGDLLQEIEPEGLSKANWIPSLGVKYVVGIDGISMLLVLLTTMLGFIAILSSWTSIKRKVPEYYAAMLLLQTGMLGVFVSLDFFLFYIFWEVMLVPMYFIIGVWGGPRKIYAAVKFFIYTLLGSLLMLIGILALYLYHGSVTELYTFDVRILQGMGAWTDWFPLQYWVWLAFFVGVAIKVPMFPFHTWLPDAHVEAPTAGSVILAGV